MRQYALFIPVFLGLLCTGGAMARLEPPVTDYQLRLSLIDESCRISDDDAQRFYKQRRQNDTRYNGFSGDEQLPSKSIKLQIMHALSFAHCYKILAQHEEQVPDRSKLLICLRLDTSHLTGTIYLAHVPS